MKERVFAAFIYVTETEHDGVMRMFDWQERRYDGDNQLYLEAEMPKGDHTVKVVATKQDEMGMTAAATNAMKVIERYRPMYLIMPGIAAGLGEETAEDQLYGDVLLADAVWDYSCGKYVRPEDAEIRFGDIGFIPKPAIAVVDEKLIPLFKQAAKAEDNECHVHIGHIACGHSVVANRTLLDKQINGQFAATKGLEMESYGIVYAATHASEPRPYPIIAKSVCDFANEVKSDNYQKFAAFTSCEFCRYLCEKILPEDLI